MWENPPPCCCFHVTPKFKKYIGVLKKSEDEKVQMFYDHFRRWKQKSQENYVNFVLCTWKVNWRNNKAGTLKYSQLLMYNCIQSSDLLSVFELWKESRQGKKWEVFSSLTRCLMRGRHIPKHYRVYSHMTCGSAGWWMKKVGVEDVSNPHNRRNKPQGVYSFRRKVHWG